MVSNVKFNSRRTISTFLRGKINKVSERLAYIGGTHHPFGPNTTEYRVNCCS